MTKQEFLKKAEMYARYLNQFLSDGDLPKVLETIRELERLRRQAEEAGLAE